MPEGALAGRRIVVTRPREYAPSIASGLERHEATVIVMPLLEIEPIADEDAAVLDDALSRVEAYDWIVRQ